jgi:hypothetical protein
LQISQLASGALTEEVIPMNGIRAAHAERSQPTGDRIAVTLIPKATEALRLLQQGTSLSKTDLANRAIILYQFVDDQLRSGHDIIARDQATGETQLVKLIVAPEGQAVAAGLAHTGRGRAAPSRRWRHGRHRRPQPVPRRPRIPVLPRRPRLAIAACFMFLAGLVVRM